MVLASAYHLELFVSRYNSEGECIPGWGELPEYCKLFSDSESVRERIAGNYVSLIKKAGDSTPFAIFLCDFSGLKYVLLRSSDGGAACVTTRSPIRDSEHLYLLAMREGLSYRHMRSCWDEVAAIDEGVVQHLRTILDEDFKKGLDSLEDLVKAYYKPQNNGSPHMFASDISRLAFLRNARGEIQGANDTFVSLASTPNSVTRGYRLQNDTTKRLEVPILGCLTKELKTAPLDEVRKISYELFPSMENISPRDKLISTEEAKSGNAKMFYPAGVAWAKGLPQLEEPASDYTGERWITFLEEKVSKEEWKTFLNFLLPLAISNLGSVDGHHKRRERACLLDTLDNVVCISAKTKGVDQNTEPPIEGVKRYLTAVKVNDLDQESAETAVETLLKDLELPEESPESLRGRPRKVPREFACVFKISDSISAASVLTDILDIAKYFDDCNHTTTPLVVRARGPKLKKVRGYRSPPSLAKQQQDFGVRALAEFEIEADNIYASFSAPHGRPKTLGIDILLECAPRVLFLKNIKLLEEHWSGKEPAKLPTPR